MISDLLLFYYYYFSFHFFPYYILKLKPIRMAMRRKKKWTEKMSSGQAGSWCHRRPSVRTMIGRKRDFSQCEVLGRWG